MGYPGAGSGAHLTPAGMGAIQMRIVLIAAGTRQAQWVRDGYQDYARRLRGSCRLELVEISLGRRSSSVPASRAVEEEAVRIMRAIPRGARVVVLHVGGFAWTTSQLAARMTAWMAGAAPVCVVAGGPDGLSSSVLERADEQWSLSPLTLPHGLVRPLVAEALYRAWSVNEGHPYHRG